MLLLLLGCSEHFWDKKGGGHPPRTNFLAPPSLHVDVFAHPKAPEPHSQEIFTGLHPVSTMDGELPLQPLLPAGGRGPGAGAEGSSL